MPTSVNDIEMTSTDMMKLPPPQPVIKEEMSHVTDEATMTLPPQTTVDNMEITNVIQKENQPPIIKKEEEVKKEEEQQKFKNIPVDKFYGP